MLHEPCSSVLPLHSVFVRPSCLGRKLDSLSKTIWVTDNGFYSRPRISRLNNFDKHLGRHVEKQNAIRSQPS